MKLAIKAEYVCEYDYVAVHGASRFNRSCAQASLCGTDLWTDPNWTRPGQAGIPGSPWETRAMDSTPHEGGMGGPLLTG
jgi:hypothetical protein